MDINELSPEQLQALEEQLKEKKQAEATRRKQDLEALETLENDVLAELFSEAKTLSNALVMFKRKCLDKLEPLIQMKINYRKAAPEQSSYTFKKADNSVYSKIRYNHAIRYDDGIQAAVTLAKQWLQNQIQDEKTQRLVNIIDKLLTKDSKGNYSPVDLLEFINLAEEYNEEMLLQAAEAMKQSIYEDMTSVSVIFNYKDDLGVERQLPLSTTKA